MTTIGQPLEHAFARKQERSFLDFDDKACSLVINFSVPIPASA